jgi:NADH:ubiquinone oxidoreductase subunit 6 (subunit J)
MAVSAIVVILMVIMIILLFVSMVLSAIGADNVNKKEYETGWKYAMLSAVISGTSVAVIIVIMIIYIMQAKDAVDPGEYKAHLAQLAATN